jgi:hypothetical protein
VLSTVQRSTLFSKAERGARQAGQRMPTLEGFKGAALG